MNRRALIFYIVISLLSGLGSYYGIPVIISSPSISDER